MGRRTWIKVFTDKWLRGTIREETAETRGVWIDILTLAGDSTYGDEGYIKLANKMGYTDDQISKILQLKNLSLWLEVKKKLQKTERIEVFEGNVIGIINWKKYQSEYERQKPHREKNFIKLREEIKERDSFACQQCNKSETDLSVPLCVHHINNNPKDNREENLITLCMSCHSHLLKKAVHPTKEKERKEQEDRFNSKVQQQSSKEKREERREKEIEKILYKEFVFLTPEEFKKLMEAYGSTTTRLYIDKLNSYIGSKGKRYKSHYHTILNWLMKDNIKKVPKPYTNPHGTPDPKNKKKIADLVKSTAKDIGGKKWIKPTQ